MVVGVCLGDYQVLVQSGEGMSYLCQRQGKSHESYHKDTTAAEQRDQ